MGCFSWCFANKNNKERLRCGKKGYIACPDGTFIIINAYDGYGKFSGHDIYDLVVDWNKEYIFKVNERLQANENPLRGPVYTEDRTLFSIYTELNGDDKKVQQKVDKLIAKNILSNYLSTDWKRTIGICIACYDEDNERLPFPIKIVSTDKCKQKYMDLPASKKDHLQGC